MVVLLDNATLDDHLNVLKASSSYNQKKSTLQVQKNAYQYIIPVLLHLVFVVWMVGLETEKKNKQID